MACLTQNVLESSQIPHALSRTSRHFWIMLGHEKWNTTFLILLPSAPQIACDSLPKRRLQTLDIVGNVSPDLVLMDIEMPRMGGPEATRLIKAQHSDTGIVTLTVSDDEDDLLLAEFRS